MSMLVTSSYTTKLTSLCSVIRANVLNKMSHAPPLSYHRLTADERAQLEAQLSEAQQRVVALASQLNTGVGFVWLPEELLIEVFKWHRALWERECDVQRGRNAYGWITVTHVCHRWRDVALHAPSLWTRIRAMHSECVQAFLERSRTMPISVEGHMQVAGCEWLEGLEVWAHVFKHTDRLQALRCEYTSEEEFDVLRGIAFAFNRRPLPALKMLALVGRGNTSNLPLALEPLESHSVLEDLDISCYSFPVVRKLMSSSLKELAISFCDYPGDAIGSWRELLDALRQLPQLEDLTVIEALPPALHEVGYANETEIPLICPEPVNLSQLAKLQVYTAKSAQPFATLVKNLSMPPTGKLTLTYGFSRNVWDNPADPSVLGSLLATRLSAAATSDPPFPLRALWLDLPPPSSGFYHSAVVVSGWPGVPATLNPCIGVVPDILSYAPRELFECSLQSSSIAPVLAGLVRALPLRTLRMLLVGDFARGMGEPGALAEDAWRTTFAAARDVAVLSVRGRSAAFLPHVLLPGARGEPALFPQLAVLKLRRVAFLEAAPGGEGLVPGLWFRTFAEALRARAAAHNGVRLRLLIVSLSKSVTANEIRVLQKYVDDVRWDFVVGDEGELDSEEEDDVDAFDDEEAPEGVYPVP